MGSDYPTITLQKYSNECGGLTLAGRQVHTKVLYHSPSSAGQGRENITKG